MPEARSFGRRGTAPAAPQFQLPAFEALPPDETEHLSANARMLRLAGEAAAFTGLLVALITAIVMAMQPLATTMSQIYVPEALWPALTFTSPSASTHSEYLMPTVATLAWPALLVFGLFSVKRGRWPVVGLCAAAIAFPWSVFGVVMPYGPAMLVLLGCAAALKLYRPSGLKLVMVLILGLVFGPVAVGVMTSVVMGVLQPGGLEKQTYRVVDFLQLEANLGLPPTAVDDFDRKIVRVTTLEGLPAQTQREKGARAFVAAQERTMRGDVAGVIAALQAVQDSGYVLNSFERDRLQVARNFATVKGGYGDAARASFESKVGWTLLVDNLSFYLAVLLGLMGPVSDVVGSRIVRRRQRIAEAQLTLSEQRAGRSDGTSGERAFGRRDTGGGLQSIAAMDGEATLNAIDRRLAFYWNSALILTVVAILCVGAGILMWLPPAASNTAFHNVALTSGAARWARQAGLAVIDGPPTLDLIITLGMMPALGLVAVTFIFFRKLAVSAGGVVLAVIVFWQIGSFFFVDQANYEVAASAISASQRAELERDAAMQPIAEHGSLPQRVEATRSVAPKMSVQPPDAAYTLAQLDYIEGRPQDIGKRLTVVAANRDALAVLAHEQRFDVMREWAGANGYPVDAQIRARNMITPMAIPRALAVPSMAIGVVAGLGAIVAACLLPVAAGRRKRIEELVTQVQYQQEAYRAAA